MDIQTVENKTYQPKDLFGFENDHNDSECQIWMVDNWALGFYCSAVYLFVIFGGRYYMKDRPRYDLRYALSAWSGALAIFSILGTVRMFPQFYDDVTERGLHFSLCDNAFMSTKPTSYWGYIFTISKLIELGDTLFIVLRKQPLIFLHYYHHITVLLYVWHSYPQRLSTSRWFALMNYAVHSLMYSYYTLRAMKVKIPRQVNITITCLQLVQMCVGLAVNIYTANVLSHGASCAVNWPNLQWAFAMYISYFVLFLKFFYETYLQPPRKQPPQQAFPKVVEAEELNGHVVKSTGHIPTEERNGYIAAKSQQNGHVFTNGTLKHKEE